MRQTPVNYIGRIQLFVKGKWSGCLFQNDVFEICVYEAAALGHWLSCNTGQSARLARRATARVLWNDNCQLWWWIEITVSHIQSSILDFCSVIIGNMEAAQTNCLHTIIFLGILLSTNISLTSTKQQCKQSYSYKLILDTWQHLFNKNFLLIK